MERSAFLTGAVATIAMNGADSASAALAELDRRYGGRLGVAALDTGTGARLAHRADERFPMCSTFKVLVAGAVLARVDAARMRLDAGVAYGKADLLHYAPVTGAHVGTGSMTVRALCAAAIVDSDNTAANLLLRTIGGPHRITAFVRSIGDPVTRLDRNEPTLNTAIPGDVRDTTSPNAMLATLAKLVTGPVLSPRARGLLASWLRACTTGTDRIRAGLPPRWSAGDKTGSGDHATSNDVAVLYPPGRPPIFVAAYYTGSSATDDERDAVLAKVGRIVSSAF